MLGESRAPQISVVIPIYAAEPESVGQLRFALEQLRASSFQDFEVWVADDASPDEQAVRDAAAAGGAKVIRMGRQCGPAAARNAAARKAAAPLLAFLDADTSVHLDTLERLVRKLRDHPELDAVMGSYDQQPAAPGIVSRFRNLLHSFVHHRANRRASTFWAGCSSIRRESFLALGGFDESFRRSSIEDVEFGMRLCGAGGSIELDPEIQVKHHKRWTLRSMVHTDLVARAIPWTVLLYRHPLPRDLNFRASDRISVLLTVAAPLAASLALLRGGPWWLAPLALLGAIALLNVALFRFLARAMSPMEAALCFPLLLVYLATCATGLAAGTVLAARPKKAESLRCGVGIADGTIPHSRSGGNTSPEL